jgi:hypothetical protein
MSKKFLAVAAIIGLAAWGLSRKKAAAVQDSSGNGGTIPVSDLTMAIVKAQQGSSGKVIDSSGKVVISAPVADAISSGGSALDAGQAYLGHQISGYTEEEYRFWAERVKGMSLHEIYTQGMTSGIPGGIVPLEVSAFLEYKTQGYSANFQALLTQDVITRLDKVWNAEEAAGETTLNPQVLMANPSLQDQSTGQTVVTVTPEMVNIAQASDTELERIKQAAVAEAQRQAEAARLAAEQAAAARSAAERAAAEQAAEAARIAAAQAAQTASQAGQTQYWNSLSDQQKSQIVAGGYFGY